MRAYPDDMPPGDMRDGRTSEAWATDTEAGEEVELDRAARAYFKDLDAVERRGGRT